MKQTDPTDPADIRISRERRTLDIRWVDGHRSVYPFDLLRKECPCALCSERRAAVPDEPRLAVLQGPVVRPGEVQATAVAPVGRYAIRFTWSDGHGDGIYSYRLLRGLCPCSVCREAASDR